MDRGGPQGQVKVRMCCAFRENEKGSETGELNSLTILLGPFQTGSKDGSFWDREDRPQRQDLRAADKQDIRYLQRHSDYLGTYVPVSMSPSDR